MALAACLSFAALAIPQKNAHQAVEIAVGASGQAQVSGAHAEGSSTVGSHMRREASSEDGALIQSNASVGPASQNLTGHPPTLTVKQAKERLEKDGLVEVFDAAADVSQAIKLEEETIECMMDTPVWECMEKHGSYGVRRLFTDKVSHYETLDAWRKDWMEDAKVQKARLFDITWPGTHNSGAYGIDEALAKNDTGKASVKGTFTQHLDVYIQLELGVRAIELHVAVGEDGQLYTANGFLMMSLATVLTDITSFLTDHKNEAVLLYAKKADVWNGIEEHHVEPLKEEESNPAKIPGESVHKGIKAVLGPHLATYTALSSLPDSELWENPTINAAITAGIRVFYFWEGQQVLCVDRHECTETPGWQRGTLGGPLPFGPGMAYGVRTNLDHGVGNTKYMEPGCIVDSAQSSSNPIQLLLNIKKHAGALMDEAKKHPSKCYPPGSSPPELHSPQLLYEADVWSSPFSEAAGAYRKVYKDIEEIYTRGESATVKSEAERVNFLALNWFLRKNWQPLFMKLNIISFDYVSPIIVHRIIEANQGRTECGYAIYCKSTGSCWAKSLLDDLSGTCKPEATQMEWLQWFADGQPWPLWFWCLLIGLSCAVVKLCFMTTICHCCGNNCFPTCVCSGGFGIVWWQRKQKAKAPPKKLVDDAPAQHNMSEEDAAAARAARSQAYQVQEDDAEPDDF